MPFVTIKVIKSKIDVRTTILLLNARIINIIEIMKLILKNNLFWVLKEKFIRLNEIILQNIINSAINSELPKDPYLFKPKKSFSVITLLDNKKREVLRDEASHIVIKIEKKGITQIALKTNKRELWFQLILFIKIVAENTPNNEIKPPRVENTLYSL